MYILKQTTGRPARGDTSSLPGAPSQSWEAGRSKRTYGILSIGLLVSTQYRWALKLRGHLPDTRKSSR